MFKGNALLKTTSEIYIFKNEMFKGSTVQLLNIFFERRYKLTLRYHGNQPTIMIFIWYKNNYTLFFNPTSTYKHACTSWNLNIVSRQ